MPKLKNARHELFAQGLFKGLSATEAYEKAGYKPHRPSASRLLTKANVKARVAELQEKAADKAEWTAAERLSSLKAIHDAQKENDPRVAISAISEANKMQGSHAPAKREHTGANGGPIQTMDVTNLTDEQLAALDAAFSGVADDQEGDTPEG